LPCGPQSQLQVAIERPLTVDAAHPFTQKIRDDVLKVLQLTA
jgi:hypothetical protein